MILSNSIHVELSEALFTLGLDEVCPVEISDEFFMLLIKMAKIWSSSIAATTLSARRCDMRRFVKWSSEEGKAPFSSRVGLALLLEEFLSYVGRTLTAGSTGRVSSTLSAFARALEIDNLVPGSKERRRLEVRAATKRSITTGREYKKPRLKISEIKAMRDLAEVRVELGLRAQRDLVLFDVMCDLLARRSELSSLRWSDVALFSRKITIAYSKTDQAGRGAVFSLSPRTIASLSTWRAVYCDNVDDSDIDGFPVFPVVRNSGKFGVDTNGSPSPMDGKSIARAIQGFAGKLGIDGVAGHTLRRSMAKALYEAGVPEEEIVRKGRWSSIEQMREYVGLTTPIRGAVDMIF